jgi:hypothetical protein
VYKFLIFLINLLLDPVRNLYRQFHWKKIVGFYEENKDNNIELLYRFQAHLEIYDPPAHGHTIDDSYQYAVRISRQLSKFKKKNNIR